MEKITGKNKRYLLWGVSVLMFLCFIGCTVSTVMIPVRYLLAFGVICVMLYGSLFLLQRRGWLRIGISAVIELALFCVFLYGIVIWVRTTQMMDEITETTTETEVISAYVLRESNLQSLQEATDAKFGVVDGQAETVVAQALERLTAENGTKLWIIGYEDMFSAAEALREGEIQVLILSEVYGSIISEIEGYEWFNTEVYAIERVSVGLEVQKYETTSEDETPTQEDSVSENSKEEISDQSKTEISTSETEETQQREQVKELMEAPEQVDWNTLVDQEILETPEGTFIVYVSGVDAWGGVTARSRSDVNILVVVNTNTKKVLLVSTPRDYYVPLPSSKGVKDKLTHAGIYGIDTSVGALEMLYGVDISYYVRVNFTGFVGIIDALDGVDVYSDSEFTVGDVFSYKVGINHMNGIEALAFARERHSFMSGDRARGTHQMEVIKAVLSKCVSKAVLYRYAEVMNSISGCFTTNMSKEKIAAMVKMQLADMASWSVDSISVDGTGASKTTYTVPGKEAYVMIPDEDTVKKAKKAIENLLAGN